MAASTQLMTYLRGLGLSEDQIQALLATASGDAAMNENDIAAAGQRLAQGGGLPGGGGGAPSTPGAGQSPSTPQGFGPNPGGQDAPANFPLPPSYGVPTTLPTDAAGVQAYNASIATGLLSGAIPSPYAYAAGQRGQNPENRPTSMDGGAGDGSPEARLPSMPYAGTVMASTLTPEQAASIRYDTPEFRAWLAAQPNGANEFTSNTLSNYRQSGSYAGTQPDLNSGIMAVHQDRFGRIQAANPNITWDQYVRSLAPSERNTVEQITGAQTTTGQTAQLDPNFMAPKAPMYSQGAASPAAQPGTILDMNSQSGYTTPAMPATSAGWQMPAGVQTGSAVVAPPGALPAPTRQMETLPNTAGSMAYAGGALPAPPPVDYSGAIATNQKYVANISAIPEAQRTPEQKASLAAAQEKIRTYSAR